ncbi:MAG: hypothetical protein LBQ66_09450 [Planctomycetaceae bacterium]|nr:hypothetical protein [Planctomycetaceae bacterium]
MCGIARALPCAMSLLPFQGVDTANKRHKCNSPTISEIIRKNILENSCSYAEDCGAR